MTKVTQNAFDFAQHVALDGVVTQENVVYLAHYVQVLMDEYDARIAELERQLATARGRAILQRSALPTTETGDMIYA